MLPLHLRPGGVPPLPDHVRASLDERERAELLRLWDLGKAADYLTDPPDRGMICARLAKLLAGKPAEVVAWAVAATP